MNLPTALYASKYISSRPNLSDGIRNYVGIKQSTYVGIYDMYVRVRTYPATSLFCAGTHICVFCVL